MTKLQRAGSLAAALSMFAVACADPTSPGMSRTLDNDVLGSVTTEYLGDPPWVHGLDYGEVELCKAVPADDPAGTFSFDVKVTGLDASNHDATVGVISQTTRTFSVPAGGSHCEIVFTSTKGNDGLDMVEITENTPPTDWALDSIAIRRLQYGTGLVPFPPGDQDAEDKTTRKATVYINNDMGRIVTFYNNYTAPPPPPQLCDFITFGRLVVEVGNKKVVISGNAGGNMPGGGIMGEFHIEANGVDNHVANVATYGAITSGALNGLTNARVVTGTAKNGVAVELRLWDGGEPGKGTDKVYVKLGSTEILGAAGKFIDQGNMQYHPTCRGPKD